MIVSRNDIYEKIVTACEEVRTAWNKSLVVIYPNFPDPDFNKQTDTFVDVSIDFNGGGSTGFGEATMQRVYGNIVVEVYSKKGTGTKEMDALLELYYRKLNNTDKLYPARTLAASFTPMNTWNDWNRASTVIPLWYDSEL